MFCVYTGRTGATKTYNAVRHLFREWLYGANIATDTPLFFEKYARHPLLLKILRYKFTPGEIVNFTNLEDLAPLKNFIVFLDEATMFLDSKSWESLPSWFAAKMRQHRKDGFDLMITVQNFKNLNIDARRLVQEWYLCERIFGIGDGKLMKLILKQRGRMLFGLYWVKKMDVYSYGDNVDEKEVPVLVRKPKIIWWFTRPLYDTMYKVNTEYIRTTIQMVWKIQGSNLYESISSRVYPLVDTWGVKSLSKSLLKSLSRTTK